MFTKVVRREEVGDALQKLETYNSIHDRNILSVTDQMTRKRVHGSVRTHLDILKGESRCEVWEYRWPSFRQRRSAWKD